MNQGRRSMLGMALLGVTYPLMAAPPAGNGAPAGLPPAARAALDRELAAIAANPACELASLSVLAIRNGRVSYEAQFGRRLIGNLGATGGVASRPVDSHTLFRIA